MILAKSWNMEIFHGKSQILLSLIFFKNNQANQISSSLLPHQCILALELLSLSFRQVYSFEHSEFL